MLDWLQQLATEAQTPDVSMTRTIITLGFATAYSYAVALTYRRTYQGKQYSANFAHSIILLGALVSLVIAIIGNSVARAFGVFGALSVVRYRVPIKDPKDIVFVLATVVLGLVCGVGEYLEAGLATAFFVLLVFLLRVCPLGLFPPADNSPPPTTLDEDDEEEEDDGFYQKPPKKRKRKHKEAAGPTAGEGSPTDPKHKHDQSAKGP